MQISSFFFFKSEHDYVGGRNERRNARYAFDLISGSPQAGYLGLILIDAARCELDKGTWLCSFFFFPQHKARYACSMRMSPGMFVFFSHGLSLCVHTGG